jgi:eukaryotic-like serine/threonine-protein kinase
MDDGCLWLSRIGWDQVNMAGSQLKSESGSGSQGAGFPFAWRSPVVPVSETVITNVRPESVAVPAEVVPTTSPDLMRRLFPAAGDVDDVLGIRVGHFTIQRRIGMGGMGSVFLATDELLRRNVALKILAPALTTDPSAVVRFQNEARAAARLDHDNIARIFFYGQDAGLHYIAYEYIPGSNLRDVITAKQRLAPAEAVNYAMQLATALSHTSAAGVVHRDIKPSNVLITPQGRAKLVDLGLARKESTEGSAELTVAGTTLGTFDYISPEQAKDPRSVDVRSDIYSLGCTLYHMLTGEPPYPEGTVLQKLLDHQGKEAPDPVRKNRRVPPALSAVVRKMMASEPRRRYATPADLLSDLLQVARSLGTGAVPIDGQVWLTATRFEQPLWQRNIGWIATAATLILFVGIMQRFPDLSRRLDPRALSTPQPFPGTAPSTSQATAAVRRIEGSVPPEPSAPLAAAAPSIELKNRSAPSAKLTNPIQSVVTGDSPFASTGPGSTPASPISKMFDASELPLLSSLPEEIEGPGELATIPSQPSTMVSVPPPARPESVLDRPVVSRSPTAELEKPPVSVTVPEVKPVISIIGGKSYDSLEAACSEARDGTIIELRYDGRRGQVERPLRLPKKDNVIIRSGIGFHPVIEFAPTEPPTDASQSRMVTITGGSLEIINVGILFTIPKAITADRWALFSLERPKELQLHDVTVTVVNASNQPACVIEQVAAPGQGVGNMGIMKNGMTLEPPKVSILDSLFRGQSDLIVLRDAVPARFQLKDTVVAMQGTLFHAICPTELSRSETDRVVLELDHTTCVTADSLIVTEGIDNLTDHTPPLLVMARNNVFSCPAGKPLVVMTDAGDLMEMQRRFIWNGDRNFYDSVEVFWQLGGRQGPTVARQLDFDAWRNYWGANEGTGSTNAAVVWKTKPLERSWTKIDVSSVELDATSRSNPAVNGASDGRDAGATLGRIPAIPGSQSDPETGRDLGDPEFE